MTDNHGPGGKPEIFIAVPVYRGQETVGETLRSIRDQTFRNYRVLVSVEGGDDESLAACRPFAADPRVTLIQQPRRHGWAVHLSELIAACDCPYFCYWQQDDLAAANYLDALRRELLADPEAAVAYADVQWFGSRFERDSWPSIVGTPRQRVLQAIEDIRYEPLRGLFRREALARLDALTPRHDEGCHIEFPFLVHAAIHGNFRRMPGTLYFKRAHAGNTFGRWNSWRPARKRAAWVEMGASFYRIAVPEFDQRDHGRLIATIIDRLSVRRPGRGFFLDPTASPLEVERITREFLNRARVDIVDQYDEPDADPFARPVSPNVLDALRTARHHARVRKHIGEFAMSVRSGADGVALLGNGWSHAEEWGIWSDGAEATLRLPALGRGAWRIRLEGRAFAAPDQTDGAAVRVEGRLGAAEFRESLPAGVEASIELTATSLEGPEELTLSLPDRVYLPDIGINDPREVAFALSRISAARAA